MAEVACLMSRCHCVCAAAGLGGGSANAATALWAANELSGRPATEVQLQDWSGDIGSDISFYFSRGAAYCTGRWDGKDGLLLVGRQYNGKG